MSHTRKIVFVLAVAALLWTLLTIARSDEETAATPEVAAARLVRTPDFSRMQAAAQDDRDRAAWYAGVKRAEDEAAWYAAVAEAEERAAQEAEERAERERQARAAREAEEARRAASAPSPASSATPAPGSNYERFLRLADCESGDGSPGSANWHINTGNGYYGGLQFSLDTWRRAGGTGYPHEHSRDTQIAIAESWLARTSWAQWPACSKKLGYR